jgi:hypothetical protein
MIAIEHAGRGWSDRQVRNCLRAHCGASERQHSNANQESESHFRSPSDLKDRLTRTIMTGERYFNASRASQFIGGVLRKKSEGGKRNVLKALGF